MTEDIIYMGVAYCQRCGKACIGGIGSEDARPLRRAMYGYCADCAITQFLKQTEPIASIIDGAPWDPVGKGPSVLLNPHIQDDMQRMFTAGHSDADNRHINWGRVVEMWDKPFPKRLRRETHQ